MAYTPEKFAEVRREIGENALAQLSQDQHKSKRRATLTYIFGGVMAFLGTASAFLANVDWNVLFSPQGAGLASAGVGLAGAVVVFVRAVVVFAQPRSE